MNKLEERGYLVRTTNAKDKRTYDISPTEKAWEIYPFIKEQVEACFQRMTHTMTDQEREEFRRLLQLAAEAGPSLWTRSNGACVLLALSQNCRYNGISLRKKEENHVF